MLLKKNNLNKNDKGYINNKKFRFNILFPEKT